MKLTFDPNDLRPEFKEGEGNDVRQALPTSQISYEHLNDQAQEAVRVVGRGTFYTWNQENYNAIYPPK